MAETLAILSDVGKALNYITDNPAQLGIILLIGGGIGVYLHRNSRNGKTAVTLATMIIVGLVLTFN